MDKFEEYKEARLGLIELSADIAGMIAETCSSCFAGKLKRNFSTEKGCCSRCAYNSGYHRTLSADELLALKTEYSFDDKKGFLGETGCKLPREKRAHICLVFICGTIRNEYPSLAGAIEMAEEFHDQSMDSWSTYIKEKNYGQI